MRSVIRSRHLDIDNMLHRHKDPAVVAAEIKMCRTQQHHGACLVVEGRDDRKFWDTRQHGDSTLVEAEGKHNVVGGIRLLDQEKFAGALGVVDSNHDHLEGQGLASKNLVATNAHDLECVMCMSTALDGVMAEHGDPKKVNDFQRKTGIGVREALLQRSLIFGNIRWAAKRFPLEIDSSHIRIPRFLDKADWTVKERYLIQVIAQKSETSETDLQRRIADLPPANPWHIAHGHDMIDILRIGLQHVLGDIQPSVGREQISALLRAGMPLSELQQMKLGKDILIWEQENPPFRILAD